MLRLMHFSMLYPAYVQELYRRHPGLEHESFSHQDDVRHADFFPGPGWSVALSAYGYETCDFPMSIRSAQVAWAKEHGISFREEHWSLDIAFAQVKHVAPDVLGIDPYVVPPHWLREVRETCPSIKLVLSRYSSPRKDLTRFRTSDLVVSGDRAQVRALRALGVDAVLHHHAFDDRVLSQLPPRSTGSNILVSGQLLRYRGFHLYRAAVLEALADAQLPLELRLLVHDATLTGRVKQSVNRVLWDLVAGLGERGVSEAALRKMPVVSRVLAVPGPPPGPLPRALRKNLQRPVFGLQMFQVLRGAAIALNVHGDVSATDANNLRLWEATGVGACLLTDSKQNLGDLFEEGQEVVAFESPDDCVEKAQWLLENPAEREMIAQAGHQRTLRDHTYAKRVGELDVLIRERLGAG